MLDVHPPHHAASTWRDFFIHIATIVIGLLIAVGLEQTVEAVHHSHQRHQLDEDLRIEAENNQHVIERDLHMLDLEPWFVQAQLRASATAPDHGKLRFTLAQPGASPARSAPPRSATLHPRKLSGRPPARAAW